MNDEVLFGSTPIFTDLVKELEEKGESFEEMVTPLSEDLMRPPVFSEIKLSDDESEVETYSFTVSPLYTKAKAGLIRARDICTEMLKDDLPVVLNEDIVRASQIAQGGELVNDDINEPDTFEIRESFDVESLWTRDRIAAGIVDMFNAYRGNGNPFAVAEDISIEHRMEIFSNEITVAIRGTNFHDGIPVELKDWSIEKAVSDLFRVDEAMRQTSALSEAVERQKQRAQVIPATFQKTSHVEAVAELAEEYLGADGAVKAVRDASIALEPEKPVPGLQGIRPQLQIMDELQSIYPNLERPTPSIQEFVLDEVRKITNEHPNIAAVRGVNFVKNKEGGLDLHVEALVPTNEYPDSVAVPFGENTPHTLYMEPPS